ncbi:Vi polysaccharide biosynthesis UDP-N-acetylglucosamine C-6 dehydrogenase TviB, partial [Acinetobacter baumannii]|nr:Vi polysaccharide biosynthesis UDP-N-acetylglucosamine C-6 dehydrogenase TviB [Acinetobacter baumannii]
GYHPQVILAGRRINDNMARYVARNTIKLMLQNGIDVPRSKVGVLGVTFKENCPDIRNTKIVDFIKALKEYDLDLDIYDPWVDDTEVQHEYGLAPIKELQQGLYDAIVIAVAHNQFKSMSAQEFHA